MAPAEAIWACLKRYAQFSGRATRPEFWWFMLAFVVATLGLNVLLFLHIWGGLWGEVTLFLFAAAVLTPLVAAGARRARDAGLPAWAGAVFGWSFVHLSLTLPLLSVSLWLTYLAERTTVTHAIGYAVKTANMVLFPAILAALCGTVFLAMPSGWRSGHPPPSNGATEPN